MGATQGTECWERHRGRVRSWADLGLNFPFTPMSYATLGKMLELSGHNFPTQETVKITPLRENSAH